MHGDTLAKYERPLKVFFLYTDEATFRYAISGLELISENGEITHPERDVLEEAVILLKRYYWQVWFDKQFGCCDLGD